jgi:hypothetical protein
MTDVIVTPPETPDGPDRGRPDRGRLRPRRCLAMAGRILLLGLLPAALLAAGIAVFVSGPLGAGAAGGCGGG